MHIPSFFIFIFIYLFIRITNNQKEKEMGEFYLNLKGERLLYIKEKQ